MLGRPGVAGRTAAAAGIFLVASAGTYLVNDAIDAPLDRRHPDKRHRPVAAGDLSARLAAGLGSGLLACSVAAASLLGGVPLASVLGAYVLVTLAYTLRLKRVAVIELGCVSAGFVLRAVAGGAAVHVPISPWFAIVTSAASLAVVAGKRSAELAQLGDTGASLHREVLDHYPRAYLRTVRAIAAAVAIMSYALWAFERAAHIDAGPSDVDNVLFELSILPFVLGVLTFELAAETGAGGAPEELLLHNRALQLLGLSCLALVAVGIYT